MKLGSNVAMSIGITITIPLFVLACFSAFATVAGGMAFFDPVAPRYAPLLFPGGMLCFFTIIYVWSTLIDILWRVK